ncbi:MAG: MBL fold metallo-hydrolase [Anaerolineales bacterium]|nr:MBL fold metallo-hydrolase [Anaerolineales bacterium]
MPSNIFWLGHDSFRLKGEKIVYIDPWKLAPDAEKADIVLVTHEHRDHFSPDDIAKISHAGTVVVAPPSVAAKSNSQITIVKPGDKLMVHGVALEIIPAYNPNKKFHPKESGHVGYIVTLNGKRIYHAGDTDLIPEMTQIKCDIALLPVSGKYVMTAIEAAEAANTLQPALAIPMHWGDADVVGTRADAEEFKRLAKVSVEILEKSK